MNTEKTFAIDSSSCDATLAFGSHVGRRLKGGEVFEVVGDLGAGKTALTRGIVGGAGSTDDVSSPSFTISNQYEAGPLRIHHFDFYRLTEAGVMSEELKEVVGEDSSVVIIEWGDVVHDVLPTDTIRVKITYSSESSRRIEVSYQSPQFDYLFKEVA